MNEHWEEKRIRALFRELRPEHERGAPAFAKVWGAAQSQRRKGRALGRGLRVAAAGSLVMGLSVFVLVSLKPSAPRPPTVIPATPLSLSQWQSPTDFLLYPGEGLPTTPQLGESLMELEVILPDIENGGVQ